MVDEKNASSSGDGKLWAALCYIIGVLVPLFVLLTEKKNDKFVAFHAYQSLLLTVVFIVYSIAISIVTGILAAISGGLLACIVMPLSFLPLIAILFMAYKAWMGEKYPLPVLGPMADGFVK